MLTDKIVEQAAEHNCPDVIADWSKEAMYMAGFKEAVRWYEANQATHREPTEVKEQPGTSDGGERKFKLGDKVYTGWFGNTSHYTLIEAMTDYLDQLGVITELNSMGAFVHGWWWPLDCLEHPQPDQPSRQEGETEAKEGEIGMLVTDVAKENIDYTEGESWDEGFLAGSSFGYGFCRKEYASQHTAKALAEKDREIAELIAKLDLATHDIAGFKEALAESQARVKDLEYMLELANSSLNNPNKNI
jgi:hypothetical protein